MSDVGAMSCLLDQWEQFVEFVANGYEFNMDEYDLDLTVRRSIEIVVSEGRVPEWWLKKLGEVDEKFKELLVDDPVRSGDVEWWEARVPRYASEDLAADIRVRYGLVIEVR